MRRVGQRRGREEGEGKKGGGGRRGQETEEEGWGGAPMILWDGPQCLNPALLKT